MLKWLESYIIKPHDKLGRQGPMCPFVAASLRDDLLSIVIEWGIDGTSVDRLTEILRGNVDSYLEDGASAAQDDSGKRTQRARLVVFPDIADDNLAALDVAHANLKNELILRHVMLGQFHRHCKVPAARNPDFLVQVAPIPCVALRPTTLHDVLFVQDDEFRYREYIKQFGQQYANGLVQDLILIDAYENARSAFGY